MFRSIIAVLVLTVICFGQEYIYTPGSLLVGTSDDNGISVSSIDSVWRDDDHHTAEIVKKYRKNILRALEIRALRENKKFIEAEARRLEVKEK